VEVNMTNYVNIGGGWSYSFPSPRSPICIS